MKKRHILKLNMRRIFPVLTCLVILVGCMVFPASAWAIYDYEDFVTNVEMFEDGSGKEWVTLDLDRSKIRFIIRQHSPVDSTMNNASTANSSVCTVNFQEYGQYSIYVGFNDFALLANDIPEDCTFWLDIAVSGPDDMYDGYGDTSATHKHTISSTEPKVALASAFFKKDGSYITEKNLSGATWSDGYRYVFGEDTVVGKFSKPADAYSFTLNARIFNLTINKGKGGEYTFSADNFSLKFPIDSLVRLQQQQQKTNKILTRVEQELEEQGQTLDDILNGTPEQNDQIDSAVGEMQGASDKLAGVGDALNSVDRPEVDTDDLVGGYTNFDPVGLNILSIMTSNSFITDMMVIVFVFCLAGYIFFGKK